MSHYPLNELKRRLEDDGTILPKRLKLAKNALQSQQLSMLQKERVVAEWLEELANCNELSSKELRDVIGWLDVVDDTTGELRSHLIKVVSQYLHSNSLQADDIPDIISFLENDKLLNQLTIKLDEYLFITTTLLQNLHNIPDSEENIKKIFINITKYYKESKKKLEFIVKFLEGENLETVFMFIDSKSHEAVIEMCKNILFPIAKKQFFASFLLNLIRKDNVDELIAEKGDNIQSVIKIMTAFFTFPKGRTENDNKFLSDFIKIFVTCYREESQIVFAFYIMVTSLMKMQQQYLVPAMVMPPITFDENDDKIKRNIFLNMLKALLDNEVDINVRLTDTLGEKLAKVEIKKTLLLFIQTVMMGQLQLEGKIDRTTLHIIQTAIKLDPTLIEQKMDKILPNIMTAKKTKSSILEIYSQTINCLLETLFKLGRGTEFITRMLPHLKINLEACNVEQFELKQKLQEAENEESAYKIKGKIITGHDIMPEECVNVYGKLTSELMFRQNKDVLLLLQKDFEENCIMMLEEGFVSPSIITLTEMFCAILSKFLSHNKMADHTVPQQVAEDFWAAFQTFEDGCLDKFRSCIMRLNYNRPLVLAFVNLCSSVAHMKILNIKYSNTKLTIKDGEVLPFLHETDWIKFASMFQDEEVSYSLCQLHLISSIANKLLSTINNGSSDIAEAKLSIIKQLPSRPEILSNNYILKNLLTDLNKNELNQASKTLIKMYKSDRNEEMFSNEAVACNRELLQNIVMKVAKNLTECMDSAKVLSKALNKSYFDITSFVKDNDVNSLFTSQLLNQNDISVNLDILKKLQIYYLEENYQLTVILVLLLLKSCCPSKKICKSIDYILLSIYEMSLKYPDLYKIFKVDFIFDFKYKMILELLKLKIRTSNDMLIVKCVLESAVKKVKTNSEIVVNIVGILLKNHETNISRVDYFGDKAIEISCLILPLIAKERKAITTSGFRSILANLQEKLHNSILEFFKNINFSQNYDIGNTEVETADSILNAVGAYSLTLSKCCETTGGEAAKNLDSQLLGLKFFLNSAMKTIDNPTSKHPHIESSIQLLNVTLRHIKKLESHEIFQEKDKLFYGMYKCIKARLYNIYENNMDNVNYMEDMSVTLKFLAELSSVEAFNKEFLGDLTSMLALKKPEIMLKNPDITNSHLTTRKVARYLWQNCIKANIIGPKCVAITNFIFRATRNVISWIRQNYDARVIAAENGDGDNSFDVDDFYIPTTFKIEDPVIFLLRNDIDILSEVILAAKKISLDYRFLDAIFELQHLFNHFLGFLKIDDKCETNWQAFTTLFDGCIAMLNNFLLSRDELFEDRWPCFMQNYKPLIVCLCHRARNEDLTNRLIQRKFAEMAHDIEKLTQSLCKRKTHLRYIAAYAISDLSTWLTNYPPPKMIRKHLDNCMSLFMQAANSNHTTTYLARSLASSSGRLTYRHMNTMYTRYHKYTGNS